MRQTAKGAKMTRGREPGALRQNMALLPEPRDLAPLSLSRETADPPKAAKMSNGAVFAEEPMNDGDAKENLRISR